VPPPLHAVCRDPEPSGDDVSGQMIQYRSVLLWVCVAAAGCAHHRATDASIETPAQPWFCQADATGTGWQCDHDGVVNRIARRPQQPRAVEARTAAESSPPHEAAVSPNPPVGSSDTPPDGFVVQLLAMSSKQALESLAAELQVPGMSAARIERDGRLFYVLLLGVYPDRAAAEGASAARPDALQGYKPWIRRFSSLQEAIQRGNVLAASLGVAE